MTLPEVPLSGSAGRHGNLAPSLRLSVRPSFAFPAGKALEKRLLQRHPRGRRDASPWVAVSPRVSPHSVPPEMPPELRPLPGAGTGVAPSRWQMSRPDLGDAAWGGLCEGWGGGHGDGTMGTGTRRRVTTKAK